MPPLPLRHQLSSSLLSAKKMLVRATCNHLPTKAWLPTGFVHIVYVSTMYKFFTYCLRCHYVQNLYVLFTFSLCTKFVHIVYVSTTQDLCRMVHKTTVSIFHLGSTHDCEWWREFVLCLFDHATFVLQTWFLSCQSNQHHSKSDQHHSKPDQHHSKSDQHHSKSDQHHSKSDQHHSKSDQHHSKSDQHHSKSDQHHSKSDQHHSKSSFLLKPTSLMPKPVTHETI